MSETTLSFSADTRVPVAILSDNAAKNVSVKSSRLLCRLLTIFHGVVPVAGTSALSVVPLSQVVVSTMRTLSPSVVTLGNGLILTTGTRVPAPLP